MSIVTITTQQGFDNFLANPDMNSESTVQLLFDNAQITSVPNPIMLNGGIFDGFGNTITVNLSADSNWTGLFNAYSTTETSTIKNLNLVFSNGGLVPANYGALLTYDSNSTALRVNIHTVAIYPELITLGSSEGLGSSLVFPYKPFEYAQDLITIVNLQLGSSSAPVRIENTGCGSLFSVLNLPAVGNSSISAFTSWNHMILSSAASFGGVGYSYECSIGGCGWENVFVYTTLEQIGIEPGVSSIFCSTCNGLNLGQFYLYSTSNDGSKFSGPIFGNCSGCNFLTGYSANNSLNNGQYDFEGVNLNSTLTNYATPSLTITSGDTFTNTNVVTDSNLYPTNKINSNSLPWNQFLENHWNFDDPGINSDPPTLKLLSSSPWNSNNYYINNSIIDFSLVCFAETALIMLISGEYIPVKELNVNHILKTKKGHTNIKSLFKSYINGKMWIIEKDSISQGVPFQDLIISPDHAFIHNGEWHHARCSKLTREIDYTGYIYHLETNNYLEDVIYSNSLECETWGRLFRGKVKWTCLEDKCVLSLK